MKIISAILVTLILFLTVQPMLTVSCKKQQSVDKCCANKKDGQASKEKNQKDNNCCNNGQCNNPFLTCANCYFINSDKSPFTVARFFIKSMRIQTINDKVLSSYINDVWHPPKIILV